MTEFSLGGGLRPEKPMGVVSLRIREKGFYFLRDKNCRRLSISRCSHWLKLLIAETREHARAAGKRALVFVDCRDVYVFGGPPAFSYLGEQDCVVGIDPHICGEWIVAHELIQLHKCDVFPNIPAKLESLPSEFSAVAEQLIDSIRNLFIEDEVFSRGFDVDECLEFHIRHAEEMAMMQDLPPDMPDYALMLNYFDLAAKSEIQNHLARASESTRAKYELAKLGLESRYPMQSKTARKMMQICNDTGYQPREPFLLCILRMITEESIMAAFHWDVSNLSFKVRDGRYQLEGTVSETESEKGGNGARWRSHTNTQSITMETGVQGTIR